jgi:eukaryotic-like serine/threonine-protein kinase
MRCDDRRLDRVLREADEESREFRETARHLESCPRCRERLAELCAGDQVIAETCETLRSRREPAMGWNDLSRWISISVEPLLGADNLADCETITLDFLGPASHPEMLGRIGRYDVERLIGAGGMGIVLKAFDTDLHRVVAIKVLLPNLATGAAARRRFAREAQAAAAVVHEHVIPIYNVETDGDLPYLVMQYVPGPSLQTRVDERGPLPIKEVLRIARQAAAGLAAAHAQGVVHRDVKPANILHEDAVDHVLISDFGLARTADDATLTRTGILAGTPHYMSPEQASGHAVDPRSDLFSLGSVIYFMCTGGPPYRADSPMAVLNRICHEPHRPVDEVNPDVPFELAELVDRLLEKEPGQRFASALEVEGRCAALLAALQQGRRLRRRTLLGRFRRNRPAVRRVAIGAVAATVFMALGAGVMWLAGPRILDATGANKNREANSRLPSTATSLEPPDPFPRALLETQQRLRAIEEQNTINDSAADAEDDAQWSAEISSLAAMVSPRQFPVPEASTHATQTQAPLQQKD